VLQANQFQKEKFWDISDTDTQAFAVSSADTVVIAVRGTTGPADWNQNYQADTVPFKEGPAPHGERLQVHKGFYEAFRSLKEELDAYLQDHLEGEKSVFVCGHSLGGAIGLLISAYLTSSWGASPLLYTYGMPRAAERPFAEHYAADGPEPFTHHRHVHHQDPVPQSPPPQYEGDFRKIIGTNRQARGASPGHLDKAVSKVLLGVTQINWDSAYTHHGQLTYLPSVQYDWSTPVVDPDATDIVSLTEKARNFPSVFFETDDRVETREHQRADHGRVAYATVLQQRLTLEINTFLDNACGDGAEANGSRIGAQDASGRYRSHTQKIEKLREELESLWDQEEALIAEEKQESQDERRPASLAHDDRLQTLHRKQEQVEDALADALQRRAETFKDERSFLLQTPAPDWPEAPCDTLQRFQNGGGGGA
jgi:ElaB/YqjD/DUF883 family membrane-anchored ribosome-binding protein